MEELTIGDLQNVTCLYNKFNNHQFKEYKVPNVCIPNFMELMTIPTIVENLDEYHTVAKAYKDEAEDIYELFDKLIAIATDRTQIETHYGSILEEAFYIYHSGARSFDFSFELIKENADFILNNKSDINHIMYDMYSAYVSMNDYVITISTLNTIVEYLTKLSNLKSEYEMLTEYYDYWWSMYDSLRECIIQCAKVHLPKTIKNRMPKKFTTVLNELYKYVS